MRNLATIVATLSLTAFAHAGTVVKGLEFGVTTMEDAKRILLDLDSPSLCTEYACFVSPKSRIDIGPTRTNREVCVHELCGRKEDCHPELPQIDACVEMTLKQRAERFEEARTFGYSRFTSLLVGFTDQKILANMFLRFRESEFPALLDAMSQKWGKPRLKSEAIQNRMGAKFEQVTASWETADVRIELQRYTVDLDSSSVSIEAKKLKVATPPKAAPKF